MTQAKFAACLKMKWQNRTTILYLHWNYMQVMVTQQCFDAEDLGINLKDVNLLQLK